MRPGEVAAEQVLLASEEGLSPWATLYGFGWRWAGASVATWNDVAAVLAEIWRRLPQCPTRHRALSIEPPVQSLYPILPAKARSALRRVA